MPYIKLVDRDRYDELIEALARQLINRPCGDVNYVISSLLDKLIEPVSYTGINDMIGVLECVKQEYYRRVAAPYEDKKIRQNGDVY